MKIKAFKRIGVLLLACSIMITFSATAFALENKALKAESGTISSNQIYTINMGRLEKRRTCRVTIKPSGSFLANNQTIHWRVYKDNELAFMSGDTKVNGTFSQGNLDLRAGNYYIEVTNNASWGVKVEASIEWTEY